MLRASPPMATTNISALILKALAGVARFLTVAFTLALSTQDAGIPGSFTQGVRSHFSK
jgi:hypothetical protein